MKTTSANMDYSLGDFLALSSSGRGSDRGGRKINAPLKNDVDVEMAEGAYMLDFYSEQELADDVATPIKLKKPAGRPSDVGKGGPGSPPPDGKASNSRGFKGSAVLNANTGKVKETPLNNDEEENSIRDGAPYSMVRPVRTRKADPVRKDRRVSETSVRGEKESDSALLAEENFFASVYRKDQKQSVYQPRRDRKSDSMLDASAIHSRILRHTATDESVYFKKKPNSIKESDAVESVMADALPSSYHLNGNPNAAKSAFELKMAVEELENILSPVSSPGGSENDLTAASERFGGTMFKPRTKATGDRPSPVNRNGPHKDDVAYFEDNYVPSSSSSSSSGSSDSEDSGSSSNESSSSEESSDTSSEPAPSSLPPATRRAGPLRNPPRRAFLPPSLQTGAALPRLHSFAARNRQQFIHYQQQYINAQQRDGVGEGRQAMSVPPVERRPVPPPGSPQNSSPPRRHLQRSQSAITPQQYMKLGGVSMRTRLKVQPDPDGPPLTDPSPFEGRFHEVIGITLEEFARWVDSPDEEALAIIDDQEEKKMNKKKQKKKRNKKRK